MSKKKVENHSHHKHSHVHREYSNPDPRTNSPLDTPTSQEFIERYKKLKKQEKKTYYIKIFKFISMLVLVVIFLIAEMVGGIIGNSLALISDAFHMTSDSISHVIGLTAVILSARQKTKKLSYGWGRSEVLGAMINSVFLLSVVYFIYVESLQRFITPEPVHEPWMIAIVGFLGLLVNVIGLFVFGFDEGGHDHGGGSKIHLDDHQECCYLVLEKEIQEEEEKKKKDEAEKKKRKEGWLRKIFCGKISTNVRGVLLHIFGDFLGSVGVMISSILLIFMEGTYHISEEGTCTGHCWLLFIDPIISTMIATLILCTTVPLFYQTVKILMQSVPKGVDLHKLEEDIKKIDTVDDIHQLHVWNLVGDRYVCSMHLCMSKPSKFNLVANKIKILLHQNGIHSSTIQPEFGKIVFHEAHGDDGKIDIKIEDDVGAGKKKRASPKKGGKKVRFVLEEEKNELSDMIKFRIEQIITEMNAAKDDDVIELDVEKARSVLKIAEGKLSELVKKQLEIKKKIKEEKEREEIEKLKKLKKKEIEKEEEEEEGEGEWETVTESEGEYTDATETEGEYETVTESEEDKKKVDEKNIDKKN